MGCRVSDMMLEKARGAVGGETRASGARQEIEKREEGGRSGGAGDEERVSGRHKKGGVFEYLTPYL